MRDAIGRLFVAAEPRLKQFYRESYDKQGGAGGGAGGGAEQRRSGDEGEGGDATAAEREFRCSECYHLFGVDLIADAEDRMHVIEVNVEPGAARVPLA